MFTWEGGLRLTRANLAVDFPRRQPRAFISHAHNDHMAHHEYALCTPATAALYRLRVGRLPTLELPYRKPIQWGGLRLTTYPAGHCLGSAMLLAEDENESLLFTGDFKLSESATVEQAELPHADTLVIESTYGDPRYRLPPRSEAIEMLYKRVRKVIEQGELPVVEAYVLGKAQEVTRLLNLEGFHVIQHPRVYEITRIYEEFNIPMSYSKYDGRLPAGCVLVVPPHTPRLQRYPGKEIRLGLSGWALDRKIAKRLGVDWAIPLSDHADYAELLEAVAKVAPKKVYCTHGPESFVENLRKEGFNAEYLGNATKHKA